MRDGVLLTTEVYLPAAPGRHAVVMERSPYSGNGTTTRTECDDPKMQFWAHNGYAAIYQHVRGIYGSQGNFDPIQQEGPDGYDAVEWAAAQPWSNGQVGMMGRSYDGVAPWQAAIHAPPHLVAIATEVTSTDYHDHWTYVNGVFDLWFAQTWLLNFFAADAYKRLLVAQGMAPEQVERTVDAWLLIGHQNIFDKWVWDLPLMNFPYFRTPPVALYYYNWLKHPNYDNYWARVDVERHYGDVKVPAMITGGWYDPFAIGTVRSFQGMKSQGGSLAARNGTKLAMECCGHGGSGVIDWGAASAVNKPDFALRFFDHYLKGIDNGIDREPAVKLMVMLPPDAGTKGSSFFITADQFPLADTETMKFNLRSRGHANTGKGDGVLAEDVPSQGPPDNFVYDPQSPVPTLGGGLCCDRIRIAAAAQDQSSIEMRNDVLVYSSEPLTHDLTVIGPVTVKFWAATSARDTDFTAKFVDVYPDGFAQNVLDRVVRARFRLGSKLPPSFITPNKPYEYELYLGDTAIILKAGHLIRLDLSSSNFPHFARNLNTGPDHDDDATFIVARQQIIHDRQHPSYLELSVAPGISVPKP
jgi:putative CocE/NonD family hydrolase